MASLWERGPMGLAPGALRATGRLTSPGIGDVRHCGTTGELHHGKDAMTATPAAPSRPNLYATLGPVALALSALLWAFWTTFGDLVNAWNNNPQYSHGFLVPVFAGFLLWMRRNKLDLDACRPSWWGFPLIVAGLALRLFATYKYFISLEPMALLPCIAGIVLIFGGRAAWCWAWPAVLFLAFMIPLPYSVATALSGPLQRLATVTSTFVMQTPGHACSG